MKAQTRITFLNDSGEKFFGEGPCRLLRAVEETGSLRAAAASMQMAYSKALSMLKHAESALGFPLTDRTSGGRDGGGSTLTDQGRAWLTAYETYRDACLRANLQLYDQSFPISTAPFAPACVIMASGLGKRFGGNKLMAEFHDQPLLGRILDVTDGLFARRVVVTRQEDIAALCRQRQVDVVLHSLPHRSDTIRLGLAAVGKTDGCLFCPGDQPLLRRETVAALLRSAGEDRGSIWRPAFDGVPGAPVLFPAWALPELAALAPGETGSAVIRRYPDRVRLLPLTDGWELLDADTPQALEALRRLSEQELSVEPPVTL